MRTFIDPSTKELHGKTDLRGKTRRKANMGRKTDLKEEHGERETAKIDDTL